MGHLQVNGEALRFTQELIPFLGDVPDLAAVVLFGSSTDGTFDKRSDIDLVFWFATDRDPERFAMKAVLEALNGARAASKVTREATPVLTRLGADDLDDDFLRNTAEGIIVWGRPRLVIDKPRDAGPHALITYSTSDMDGAGKGRVQRFLYGHTTTKRTPTKTYRSSSPGAIRPDWRIAPSTLLVPTEAARDIMDGLRRLGAHATARPIYTT